MLSITTIEDRLNKMQGLKECPEYFKEFLLAYDIPAAAVARAKISDTSLSKGVGIGKQALIIVSDTADLDEAIKDAEQSSVKKQPVRFVIASHNNVVEAKDCLTGEIVSFVRNEIVNYADFFLPLAGREKSTVSTDERVDEKIAKRVASIYNLISLQNPGMAREDIVTFLFDVILLFIINSYKCLINGRKLPEYLDLHSDPRGSDFYMTLRALMDAANGSRPSVDVRDVDSRIFRSASSPLKIDSENRKALIELSGLDWMQMKIDHLGQMMQSIMVKGDTSLSENYTTSENVLRVIKPLVLNDIDKAYEESAGDGEQLKCLAEKIMNFSVLDPACGPGSFIATFWGELEKRLQKIGNELGQAMHMPIDRIYGIDNDAPALMVAKVTLLFAQLTTAGEDDEKEERAIRFLLSPNIIKGRSLLLEWEQIVSDEGKLYIVGNPPYVGARKQTDSQKEELVAVLGHIKKCGDLDLAGAYLYKAVQMMTSRDAEVALVTTNSMTQGVQVVRLWPYILKEGVHIRFAYQAFKWATDATNTTMVTVVIIGLANNDDKRECVLYTSESGGSHVPRLVKSISPYLVPGDKMVEDRRVMLDQSMPKMVKGNMPYDNGYLLLNADEKDEITASEPMVKPYLRKVIGANELLKGIERWCIWVHDDEVEEVRKIPFLNGRINEVRKLRRANKDKSVKKMADRPWSFRETNETHSQSVVIPAVSSENYEVIPVDLIGPDTIVTNLAFVIYDCEEWVMGVVSSKMHNIWIRTVCGGLETRVRYSETLGYNTFPFPEITDEQKEKIRKCVEDILVAREEDYDKPLGKHYKKGEMSDALQQAHLRLDQVIDSCYREEPFTDDQERIYYLFDLYEKYAMEGNNA